MNRLRKTAVLAASVTALDQLTKIWAIKGLVFGETVPLIPGVFHLTLTYNTGVAFGMMAGAGQWVALVALVVIVLLAASYIRSDLLNDSTDRRSLLTSWGIGLVLGGAVGNLVDRIRWGAVVDFFDFQIWPVFNVADSAITIGACLIAWTIWRRG